MLCPCGCERVANYGRWWIGHWNRGRKASEETKKKISSKHLPVGVFHHSLKTRKQLSKLRRSRSEPPRTPEWNRNVSEGRLGIVPWNKGKKTGLKHWLGRTHTKQTRNKMSQSAKLSWDKQRKENLRRWWIEHPEVKEKAHKILRPTSIELSAQQILVELSEPFFTGKSIENICIPDQVLANRKTTIFEDGCYWHGCLIHYPGEYILPNKRMISEIRTRDKFVTETLQGRGWTVIRLWEHEIKAGDFSKLKFQKEISKEREQGVRL
jgi:DNA mismatch endonuclease, patch repair protein